MHDQASSGSKTRPARGKQSTRMYKIAQCARKTRQVISAWQESPPRAWWQSCRRLVSLACVSSLFASWRCLEAQKDLFVCEGSNAISPISGPTNDEISRLQCKLVAGYHLSCWLAGITKFGRPLDSVDSSSYAKRAASFSKSVKPMHTAGRKCANLWRHAEAACSLQVLSLCHRGSVCFAAPVYL